MGVPQPADSPSRSAHGLQSRPGVRSFRGETAWASGAGRGGLRFSWRSRWPHSRAAVRTQVPSVQPRPRLWCQLLSGQRRPRPPHRLLLHPPRPHRRPRPSQQRRSRRPRQPQPPSKLRRPLQRCPLRPQHQRRTLTLPAPRHSATTGRTATQRIIRAPALTTAASQSSTTSQLPTRPSGRARTGRTSGGAVTGRGGRRVTYRETGQPGSRRARCAPWPAGLGVGPRARRR